MPLGLPTELLLQVLSYLPIRQILLLRLCSRDWNAFIERNETYVFHAAAILHSFTAPSQRLHELKKIPGNSPPASAWLEDATSWRDVCRQYYLMEKRWTGKFPVGYGTYSCLGDAVHRFRIDDDQGTIISTHGPTAWNGLTVAAIETNQILWTIPPSFVRPFAHCEFSNGFLIFDRNPSLVEVWRRKRDAESNPLYAYPGPDERQQQGNRGALWTTASIAQGDRGVFVPFTAQEAYLYNIPTGHQLQTIVIDVTLQPIQITHVDLSEQHIFICAGDEGLLIFPRNPSEFHPLHFSPRRLNSMKAFNGLLLEYQTSPPSRSRQQNIELRELLYQRKKLASRRVPRRRKISAVHVSSCGSHLVCVSQDGYIYIIRNFEMSLHPSNATENLITALFVQNRITSMDYEDERIAFYTTDGRLFVIPFASQSRIPPGTLDLSWPTIASPWPILYQVTTGRAEQRPFEIVLRYMCVQLTRTRVWYILADTGDSTGNRHTPYSGQVHCLDFAHAPPNICDRD